MIFFVKFKILENLLLFRVILFGLVMWLFMIGLVKLVLVELVFLLGIFFFFIVLFRLRELEFVVNFCFFGVLWYLVLGGFVVFLYIVFLKFFFCLCCLYSLFLFFWYMLLDLELVYNCILCWISLEIIDVSFWKCKNYIF